MFSHGQIATAATSELGLLRMACSPFLKGAGGLGWKRQTRLGVGQLALCPNVFGAEMRPEMSGQACLFGSNHGQARRPLWLCRFRSLLFW
jgi:hypothetical protein